MQCITSSNKCCWLACINPHSYVVALENQVFAAALANADWLIPDGIGIVLASRVLKGSIHKRVTGSDIFNELNRQLNLIGGMRVFFLGASEETLELIRLKMNREFPNIVVVGTFSPPYADTFTDEDTQKMITAINVSGADVLWVGMSSPKQDLWLHCNRHLLDVKFAASIGAVFDFYTGTVVRAHPIFQGMGIEWFPRLLQDPRRLWRRMFVSAPLFLLEVMRFRTLKK